MADPVLDFGLLAGNSTEKQFMQAIINYARERGHSVYHVYDARRSEPGFPDLVIAGADGILRFWECKTQTGRVELAQERWLTAIGNCTQLDARLVRPADWPRLKVMLL